MQPDKNIFDSSYITEHFVKFQNNAEITRRNKHDRLSETSYRSRHGPKFVTKYRKSSRGGRFCRYSIAKDRYGYYHLNTTFPWEYELEWDVILSKIKSLKLTIIGSALDHPRRNTDGTISKEAIICLAMIQRMESLEELSMTPWLQSPGVTGASITRTFTCLLTALSHVDKLKRLKIKRLFLSEDNLRTLSLYLTTNTSLTDLILEESLSTSQAFSAIRHTSPYSGNLKTFFDSFGNTNSLRTLTVNNSTSASIVFESGHSFGEKYSSDPGEIYRTVDLYLRGPESNGVVYGYGNFLDTLVEISRNQPSVKAIYFPRLSWNFKGDLGPNIYAILYPSEISWLLSARRKERSKYTVNDLISCLKACNSTRVVIGGINSDSQKEDMMKVLEATSIKSLVLKKSVMTTSDIIAILTNVKSLEELTLRSVGCAGDKDFTRLFSYLSTNTTLVSLDLGEAEIQKKQEVDSLCELIEKNSTLNHLVLCNPCGSSDYPGDVYSYASFLRDIIGSMKKNSKLWQCNVMLNGSMSSFFFCRQRSLFAPDTIAPYASRKVQDFFDSFSLDVSRHLFDIRDRVLVDASKNEQKDLVEFYYTELQINYLIQNYTTSYIYPFLPEMTKKQTVTTRLCARYSHIPEDIENLIAMFFVYALKNMHVLKDKK